jgi:regulator of protease activity HflC (stomatin/prohibitin superfamily)
MSPIAWVILIILVLPMVGLLFWALLRSSFVRVPSGNLGLVLIKGRATDKSLLPGAHFVPALRRHMIEQYPSVEMSFRADGTVLDPPAADAAAPLTDSAPALTVMLGDRSLVTVAVTVRFRVEPDQLRLVHERFGPKGIFTVVRDETARAVLRALGAPDIEVRDLLGSARVDTEGRLTTAVADALHADGIELTALTLGIVDLGRTGEIVQAIARAGYELEKEEAESRTRLARARNDAELQAHLAAGTDAAWRYRSPDLLRDLAQRAINVSVNLPSDQQQIPDNAVGLPVTPEPSAESA